MDFLSDVPAMVMANSAVPAPLGSTVKCAGLLTGAERRPSPVAVQRLPSMMSQSYGVPVRKNLVEQL